MTDWHEITIFGLPVAQPRQRHRVVTSGKRAFASNYTPSRHPVNAFKASVAEAASAECAGLMSTTPIRLMVCFAFPRPKSRCRKRDGVGMIWHTSRPDIDNLLKAVTDAMTGIAWGDDSQVCSVNAEKVILAPGESAFTRISWMELSCD